MAETIPSTRHHRPGLRSLSGEAARAYLADPNRKGNKEAVLRALMGCMSVAEADAMEARINAMNEWVDDPTIHADPVP